MWASLNSSLYLKSSKDSTQSEPAKKHQGEKQKTWALFISPWLVVLYKRIILSPLTWGLFQYKYPKTSTNQYFMVHVSQGFCFRCWASWFFQIRLPLSPASGDVQESEAKEAQEVQKKIPKPKVKAKSKVIPKKPILWTNCFKVGPYQL